MTLKITCFFKKISDIMFSFKHLLSFKKKTDQSSLEVLFFINIINIKIRIAGKIKFKDLLRVYHINLTL